jgi:hypothetical protein
MCSGAGWELVLQVTTDGGVDFRVVLERILLLVELGEDCDESVAELGLLGMLHLMHSRSMDWRMTKWRVKEEVVGGDGRKDYVGSSLDRMTKMVGESCLERRAGMMVVGAVAVDGRSMDCLERDRRMVGGGAAVVVAAVGVDLD